MNRFTNWLGTRLGRYLTQPTGTPGLSPPPREGALRACIRPGDVLLVEGRTRMSVAIKYLTQSTWSHAALYVGADALRGLAIPADDTDPDPPCFVEADVVEGVRAVGFGAYAGLHLRVCRAVSLTAQEREQLIGYAVARLGHHYDLKNVVDLARFLLPTPPVPVRWRRRMLALGSGDPSRAICSTLIAQAFDSVRYPILPYIETIEAVGGDGGEIIREILHVRHHSLYVPRDFDVSPYFQIIKPTIASGFDHHQLAWHDPTG